MSDGQQIKPTEINLLDSLTFKRGTTEYKSHVTNLNDLFVSLLNGVDTFTTYEYDVNGNLTLVEIWNEPGMITKLYTADFVYDIDGNLETKTVTRIIDSATYVKTFTYDVDGNLETKTVT